jgi:hypothetical protein
MSDNPNTSIVTEQATRSAADTMTSIATNTLVSTQVAPITVAAGPAVPLIMNLLRQIGILVGGVGLIIAILGRRDMSELIRFVTSDQMVPIVTAGIFVASSLGSLWKTRHNEQVKRTLAAAAPDSFAVVRGDQSA